MRSVGESPGLLQSAAAGLRRSMAEVSARAADVSIASSADSVEFSNAALQAADSGAAVSPPATRDAPHLENALVDLRVAKYAAMANMRVVRTAADLEQEAANLVR